MRPRFTPPPRFTPSPAIVAQGRRGARLVRLRNALAKLLYHSLAAAIGWGIASGLKELLR